MTAKLNVNNEKKHYNKKTPQYETGLLFEQCGTIRD
jgi:hypothetical protein